MYKRQALWLGRKVPKHTDDKQNPIIKVSNLEDNFALAYYAGGDKSPKAVPWDTGQPILTGLSDAQIISWHVRWQNYRENLMLIEERMSEFVEFTEVPLQLVKNKRKTEAQIAELERRLGLGACGIRSRRHTLCANSFFAATAVACILPTR